MEGGAPEATEHPGGMKRQAGKKHGNRTETTREGAHQDRISGGRRTRTGRKIQGRSGPLMERPGLQKEETEAARHSNENMNKSDEGWRGDAKNKSQWTACRR